MRPLTWIDISKEALRHNMSMLRGLVGSNVLLAPCIKADAYGHGLLGVAAVTVESGADWLCVKSIEEVEVLRSAGISLPILIVGYVQISDLPRAVNADVRVRLDTRELSLALSKLAVQMKKTVPVHIKVDTGMTRLGVCYENIDEFISYILGLPNLSVEGVSTHFANADEPENQKFFKQQLGIFARIRETWQSEIPNCLWHAANSAATLLHKAAHLNLVRPGLALYGLYPSESVRRLCAERRIELRPVLSFKTRLAGLKEVSSGSKVSYGCTFETKRLTKVAVLPVGYCDGLDRKLSNRGAVLIRGRRAPIRGRVCMNLLAVDVTDIPSVSPEDEAVLIGRQGEEEISVEEVAQLTGTINYEITTRLAGSIPRHLID